METLRHFAARCRAILASDTFTPDAGVSVVYAGRPGVDYGSGPGTLLAQARGGRLMFFTEGYPLGEDKDRNPIGYAHAVLYVWPAEWPSLPFLAGAIGEGRVSSIMDADPSDHARPALPALTEQGVEAPSAEDLTSQDVYVPLDVVQVLAREERALEAALRRGDRASVAAAAIRLEVARDELISRLIPQEVRQHLCDTSSPGYATRRREIRREMFGRGFAPAEEGPC